MRLALGCAKSKLVDGGGLGLDRSSLDGVKNKLVDGRGLGLDRPALDGVKDHVDVLDTNIDLCRGFL